jgi:hypothetical protein
MTEEHSLQNKIRLALSATGRCTFFRVNAGRAWIGSRVDQLPDGSKLITDPRPFNSGVPAGFSDLVGFTIIEGKAIFTAIEVKAPKGRVTKEQQDFIDFVKKQGGLAGVARSVEEALDIIK